MIEKSITFVKARFSYYTIIGFGFILASCATAAETGNKEDVMTAQASVKLDPKAEFDRLHKLVGNWLGENERGQEVRVNYRMSAGDSVLVETWSFVGGRESLTLYHMDRERLLATHYCPIGNQPRLALKDKLPSGSLEFKFVDATNLPDIAHPHEHAFDLQIIDENTMIRNETYLSNGETDSNGIRFIRQGS